MQGSEIKQGLKTLTKGLDQLMGGLDVLKQNLKQQATPEELTKANKLIEEIDPTAKVNELKKKFEHLKTKL